ncbi:MAG: D-alanyl-D-alanine carboxypeptidase, partial [Oscillospiraceae bacterium]
TAYLSHLQEDLDTEFKLSEAALRTEGSTMGLKIGDSASLRALCYGMLLPSGNDAANAAAFRIGGSKEGFCRLMNEKAAELNMTGTNFTSPSGLDEGNNLSTAHDMAILTSAALENQDFAQMVRTKTKTVEVGSPPRQLYLKNHNRLLWEDEIIGVKTGFTKKAGRCLVTAAEIKGQRFITVTLNCGDDFNMHRAIYRELAKNLVETDFSFVLKEVKIPLTGGTKEFIKAQPTGYKRAYILKGSEGKLEVSYSVEPFLYAPVEKGKAVGRVEITQNGKRILLLPLNAMDGSDSRLSEYRSIKEIIRDFFDFPWGNELP